jgi:acetyltransferase-like isoleucine patch superfamily enzyme
MWMPDALVRRLLAGTVDSLVRDRLAAQSAEPVGEWDLPPPVIYGDRRRLHLDPTAVINDALFNLSSGEITLGQYAFLGHRVSLLTGTHDITKFGAERQVAVPKEGRDIVIEEGAWVSSHAIVIGPCRIGANAVVGVASLVLRDVEPYTVVAGSPATVRRAISSPESP